MGRQEGRTAEERRTEKGRGKTERKKSRGKTETRISSNRTVKRGKGHWIEASNAEGREAGREEAKMKEGRPEDSTTLAILAVDLSQGKVPKSYPRLPSLPPSLPPPPEHAGDLPGGHGPPVLQAR